MAFENLKPISNIIQCESDNSVFIWKHPENNFNVKSKLIVRESQEAIFMLGGKALDTFGPGEHILEPEKVPFLKKLISKIIGKEDFFSCDIYFINKVEIMSLLWGTDSPIQFIEPTYNFPLKIGASGEMTLRIENSRKLLVKVVGAESSLTARDVTKKLRPILITKLKPYIARRIKEEGISIFELDQHLDRISDGITPLLKGEYEDYGITVGKFLMTTVLLPEDDPNYRMFKQEHANIARARLVQKSSYINEETEAQRIIMRAQAMATKRATEGYTYQEEKGFEMTAEAIKNLGKGGGNSLTDMAVQAVAAKSVGDTLGNYVSSSIGNAIGHTSGGEKTTCPKCGATLGDGMKFCTVCGERIGASDTVICPVCKKSVPDGKFCGECGASLKRVCVGCGAEIGTANFCPNCGKKFE